MIFFIAAMILSMDRVVANESDYDWIVNDDGGATITGYNGGGGEVVIPDTLGGFTVTEIASSAFAGKRLTKVTIPDSVTNIGSYAFTLNGLKEVTIGANVTEIGAQSFAYNNLTSVTIPASVTSIGGYAFLNNHLEEVILSNGLESIGDWAFAENYLTSVTIPDSVTSIGNSAFSFNLLKEVTIPDSVISIENFAFADNQPNPADLTIYGYENSAAENYAKRNGHTFINMATLPEYIYEWVENDDGGATITKYNGDGGEIVIPDELAGLTVTEIQDKPRLEGVFENKGITSVILPKALKHIGNHAFRNNQLTKVVIPNDVKSIGISAFAVNKITEVDIPDSVTNIEESAFSGNQLIEVVIPENVATIGEGAFHTNNLIKVSISDGVTSIEADAFAYNQLKEVMIPNSVTNIGDRAFYFNQLTQVLVPNSVTSIGINAFGNNQSNPADLTIYGYADSIAANYATTNEHQFKAVNSPPEADIHIDGISVDNLLSEDGVLSVEYGTKEELNAVYRHHLQDDDFVKLEIESVSWKIEGIPNPVKENILELESYTDIVGERTVTLTVETNYGGKGTKEVILHIDPPIPSETDLTIDEVTETTITLSWEHVDYADEYILKRDGDEVYRGAELKFTDTGLTPNTSYRYSLVAVNKSGTSEEAILDAQTRLPIPRQPELVLESATETSIILTWDEVDYAEEYLLMRGEAEVYRGPDLKFEDIGLNPNTEYSYTLVAINDSGTSEEAAITAKTALPVPSTPNLQIEATSETSISLSWNSVQYAEEYILKRDEEEVYRGAELIFTDTGLTPNTSYRYSLVAINSSGTSEKSQIIGTTNLPEPQPKEFEIHISLNPTEKTEGPVTIKISTTSEADISSLKWLAGNKTEGDFINAGNEIDLETMAFTVEKNGKYTIYALNAEGVVALSTITISNITEYSDRAEKDTGSGEGTDSNEKDQTLPSTATNIFNLLLIGGTIMLAVGFTFILFRRRIVN